MDQSGVAVVQESRQVTFGGEDDVRWMDHEIELRPVGGSKAFNDTKEGMFAIRVADELKEEEGTGHYLNAFGWETSPEIWGKRSPWVSLAGEVGGKPVTVAIFDHPSTWNYPSYWHARGYGLFAVNPFGRKDFREGSEPINAQLSVNGVFRFRYRIVVYEGKVPKIRLDNDYWNYID